MVKSKMYKKQQQKQAQLQQPTQHVDEKAPIASVSGEGSDDDACLTILDL
jgi:hypothetical protein